MLFIFKRLIKLFLVISEFSPLALVWMIKAVLFDWVASMVASSKLPAAAEDIGLKHKKSEYIRQFGEIKGNIRGHKIEVQPFDSMYPSARIFFKTIHKGLELSISKPYMRTDKKVVDFITSDWKFNRAFRTRRIHIDMVARIEDNHELLNLINSFYIKWIFRLDALIISNDDIFCRLKYGFYFFPHIPARKLKQLVNELVILAEKIDSTL